MRAIALLAAIGLTAATSAQAAWREYTHPDLGFVLEFPDPPAESSGN